MAAQTVPMKLKELSSLPPNLTSTPGGTIFSTTPGGHLFIHSILYVL